MSELIFELLRVSISSDKCLSNTPTDKEWQALFDIIQKHALAGVCIVGLEILSNQEQTPDKGLLLNWIGLSHQIEQRNKVTKNQCLKLQKKLSEDGIKYCFLKGLGNAQMYGKINPRLSLLRQSGDIDVWVEGGYDRVLQYVDRIKPTDEVNEQHVHFHLFDNTEVEVHYTPSRLPNRFLDRKLQRWYLSEQDRQMGHVVKIEGGEIVMPTDDFNLVYQMLHIYKHFFSTDGIGLRQLMDYYVLLKVADLTEGEKNKVKGLVKSFGIEHFAEALMWILVYVFCLPGTKMLWQPDEKRGRFVLSEVMQMGNFGHSDERFTLKAEDLHLQRYWKTAKSKMRFIKFFPSEALWTPVDYFLRFLEIRGKRRRARALMKQV